MSVRAPMFAGALLLAGCGLVSGLDSLGVEGGAPQPDATTDAIGDAGADVDVPAQPDAPAETSVVDAGRAGSALQTKGGCATAGSGATLALTNDIFTIELWFRLDVASSGNELDPVLWKGGRATNEPGWSLVVEGSDLVFCVSDTSGSKCTTPYALTVGHLVHLGIRSTYTSNTPLSRSVNVYARDITAGELAHTNVGSLTGGVNNWTSNTPFTVGGAMINTLCATAPAFTIDDVRVYTMSQSIAAMDNGESVDVSCSLLGLLADYTFNEGTGTLAADCTASAFNLTLGPNQKLIPSPFP